jgi:hypothetical protein
MLKQTIMQRNLNQRRQNEMLVKQQNDEKWRLLLAKLKSTEGQVSDLKQQLTSKESKPLQSELNEVKEKAEIVNVEAPTNAEIKKLEDAIQKMQLSLEKKYNVSPQTVMTAKTNNRDFTVREESFKKIKEAEERAEAAVVASEVALEKARLAEAAKLSADTALSKAVGEKETSIAEAASLKAERALKQAEIALLLQEKEAAKLVLSAEQSKAAAYEQKMLETSALLTKSDERLKAAVAEKAEADRKVKMATSEKDAAFADTNKASIDKTAALANVSKLTNELTSAKADAFSKGQALEAAIKASEKLKTDLELQTANLAKQQDAVEKAGLAAKQQSVPEVTRKPSDKIEASVVAPLTLRVSPGRPSTVAAAGVTIPSSLPALDMQESSTQGESMSSNKGDLLQLPDAALVVEAEKQEVIKKARVIFQHVTDNILQCNGMLEKFDDTFHRKLQIQFELIDIQLQSSKLMNEVRSDKTPLDVAKANLQLLIENDGRVSEILMFLTAQTSELEKLKATTEHKKTDVTANSLLTIGMHKAAEGSKPATDDSSRPKGKSRKNKSLPKSKEPVSATEIKQQEINVFRTTSQVDIQADNLLRDLEPTTTSNGKTLHVNSAQVDNAIVKLDETLQNAQIETKILAKTTTNPKVLKAANQLNDQEEKLIETLSTIPSSRQIKESEKTELTKIIEQHSNALSNLAGIINPSGKPEENENVNTDKPFVLNQQNTIPVTKSSTLESDVLALVLDHQNIVPATQILSDIQQSVQNDAITPETGKQLTELVNTTESKKELLSQAAAAVERANEEVAEQENIVLETAQQEENHKSPPRDLDIAKTQLKKLKDDELVSQVVLAATNVQIEEHNKEAKEQINHLQEKGQILLQKKLELVTLVEKIKLNISTIENLLQYMDEEQQNNINTRLEVLKRNRIYSSPNTFTVAAAVSMTQVDVLTTRVLQDFTLSEELIRLLPNRRQQKAYQKTLEENEREQVKLQNKAQIETFKGNEKEITDLVKSLDYDGKKEDNKKLLQATIGIQNYLRNENVKTKDFLTSITKNVEFSQQLLKKVQQLSQQQADQKTKEAEKNLQQTVTNALITIPQGVLTEKIEEQVQDLPTDVRENIVAIVEKKISNSPIGRKLSARLAAKPSALLAAAKPSALLAAEPIVAIKTDDLKRATRSNKTALALPKNEIPKPPTVQTRKSARTNKDNPKAAKIALQPAAPIPTRSSTRNKKS